MTDVLYQGEYVDKDWLNMWLNTPEGKRIHEEEKAREKAAAEEERKKQQQLQKQKQAENKSREKKVAEYFHKFRQEYGPDVTISDELAQRLWQRARNTVENERHDEEYRKQREEERRQMEESNKRHRERREREAIARRELPERQLKMFLSGNHTYREPGLKLLAEEYRTGKLIKRMVGEQAYNRLIEYGKPGETWESLMNRLLDVAEKADAAIKNGLTIY